MNVKSALKAFYCRANTYNLFIPDEDNYDEEPKDSAIALKHQRYSTRL